jgi:predicted nucleic acid-binding protein
LNYLLDTCVVSELIKPKPSSKVTKWLRSCRDENLFLSVLTIGEIQKGISKLPDSRKRNDLQ